MDCRCFAETCARSCDDHHLAVHTNILPTVLSNTQWSYACFEARDFVIVNQFLVTYRYIPIPIRLFIQTSLIRIPTYLKKFTFTVRSPGLTSRSIEWPCNWAASSAYQFKSLFIPPSIVAVQFLLEVITKYNCRCISTETFDEQALPPWCATRVQPKIPWLCYSH